jgi:hypothetical protein
MRGHSRRRSWRAAVAATATGMALVASAGVAHAAAPDPQATSSTGDVTISVVPTQAWTDTGVTVEAGDRLSIAASGLVHLGAPPIDSMAPTGLPWGPQCAAIGGGNAAAWPAPGLSCYSLIGRIGSGAAFEIGDGGTFEADADGALVVGTNDNNFTDNSGAWSAAVRASASGAGAEGETATQGGSLMVVALVAGLLLAGMAALLLLLRKRAARGAVFELPGTLRAGRIDVRVGRDGTVWRVDRAGDEQPFVPFASDFAALGVEGRHGTFTWQGLQFRAVRSRLRFAGGHGEVGTPGEYVSASSGMTLDPRGHTGGLLPLSLPGAWVFTLVSVDTDTDSDEDTRHAAADGRLTMFIRDDQPFRPQADEIVASFRAFLDDLDRLLAEREARRADVRRAEASTETPAEVSDDVPTAVPARAE